MAQGRAFEESETVFWLQLSSELQVELTYQSEGRPRQQPDVFRELTERLGKAVGPSFG